MATKSDRPGLLSKMAMFVRNPTKDWSELDRPEPAAESGYDKHALKAMIERKRQNDFVRRREFDQLRKLRRREVSAAGGVARPSIFQTSVTTDLDERATTLKKIDEIEAQMSKQWWKGKQDGAAPDAAALPAAKPAAPEGLVSADGPVPAAASYFATTQSSELLRSATEFTETQMGVGMAPVLKAPPTGAVRPGLSVPQMGGLADRYDGTEVGFSTSKLFAIEVDDMATDPELEEAAIRFANGDDAGAESGLLEALRGEALLPEVARSWVGALLDFYRATDDHAKFDQATAEFGARLDRLTPVWASIPHAQAAGAAVSSPPPGAQAIASDAIWESPAELTDQAMEQLREAMSTQPMPWHLGWSRLVHISDAAMPLLAGLFASLCDEPVALRFSGVPALVQTLRAMMPSADRSVDPAWWVVRMNALRTLQMQDEFEMVALDYCVTYEVSPPAWVPARCQYEDAHGAPQGGALAPTVWDGGGFSQAATAPMGLDQAPATVLELRGEVLGDATQALTAPQGAYASGERIVVSCLGLVRVDFSAAGSILNWVAVRQAEGCSVQFRDVHRLVAAFFNVIGINEHARVVPRPM